MAEPKVEPKEEPKVEPKTEPKTNDEIEGILALLDGAGIKTKDDMQGKIDASRQAGQLANILGTVRAENQELKDMIKGLSKAPKPSGEFDYSEGQPIDIESAVRRSVKEVLDQEKKANAEQQQRVLQQYNKITTDKHYSLVKDVWEEKMKNPNFVVGNADLTEEYKNTVIDFYMGVSKKAGDVIRGMKPGAVKPPHMEGEGPTPRTEPDMPEVYEKTKILRDKSNKGYVPTTDEVVDIISDMMKGIPD